MACLVPMAAALAQDGLSEPLTATPGDAERGVEIIRDTGKASCLICHAIATLPDRDQGALGPPLDGVGGRYTQAELRQRIVDARVVSPDTIMPPYFSNDGLFRIGARWAGSTIYTAQEVEDVVAFLLTLED